MKLSWMLVLCGVMALLSVQPAPAQDGNGLVVTVGAEPSFVRTFCWTIDKSADQTCLTLGPEEEVQVNYAVTVDATSQDGDFKVEGDISIFNSGGSAVNITGVSATVAPAIAADVDCGVTFPFSLGAGQTLVCSYEADLPCTMTRNVNVTVTTDNSPATGQGVSDFSNADVTEVDECVDVVDSWGGFLGTACAGDAPVTFTYSHMIGGCVVCGSREVTNFAHFTTNDTQTTNCDSWTICVITPCEEGCTRTPGYWKTHSEFGPAPFDDTWEQLPDGASTEFFLSGKTYYEVLWTPPRGNAYYILSFQWIATQLNVLSGAAIPDDVLNAWLEAKALFETYTPDQISALKTRPASVRIRTRATRTASSDPLRQQFLSLAGILESYNEGFVGPGHCSD